VFRENYNFRETREKGKISTKLGKKENILRNSQKGKFLLNAQKSFNFVKHELFPIFVVLAFLKCLSIEVPCERKLKLKWISELFP
jgi:hypothetical protein